jgi:hypothetical protein
MLCLFPAKHRLETQILEVDMSKRTLTISTVVVVVLFALTAAVHFGLAAFSGPFGYGFRQGMDGFRGQMGPGAFAGHFGMMSAGYGWLGSLTSFGLIVLPVILVGLLILAIADRPRQEADARTQTTPEPTPEPSPAPARRSRARSK